MSKFSNINKTGLSAKELLLNTAASILFFGGGYLLIKKLVREAYEKKIEKKGLEEGSPELYAKELKMAFENDGWPGTNMVEVRRIMTQIPNKEFFDSVRVKYQQRYNRPLASELSNELQSSEYKEIVSIIAAKPSKKIKAGTAPTYNYLAWAKRLKAAFEKEYGFMPGTDEAAIKQVFFEIPTQNAFLKVTDAYLSEYHTSLITDLKSELELWEYSDYMKIITSKPN